MLVERQARHDFKAAVWTAAGLQGAAEGLGALAHSGQAEPAAVGEALPDRETGPVIGDGQAQLARDVVDGDTNAGRSRVSNDVGDRFLEDPVGGGVDGDRSWQLSPRTSSSGSTLAARAASSSGSS